MNAGVAAVILAGGFSSRMGEFKPLLTLGGKTLLMRCVDLFREAGVEHVLAVTGHRAEDVRPCLEPMGIQEVYNQRHAEGMFTSVQAGLAALPQGTEAFFLLPVDTPLIRPSSVATLLRAWEGRSGLNILHPAMLGHRGHPPLTGIAHAPHIASWNGERGLAGYFANFEAAHPEHVRTVEVPDEMILFDLDHPADFQAATKRLGRLDTPSIEECLALLNLTSASRELRAHCLGVALAGLRLAAALGRAGCPMDIDQVAAAGLLHDVAKGMADHALAGADLLRNVGFTGVAAAVAAHMTLADAPGDDVTDREVLYLADKYVQGAHIVSLEERFSDKARQFQDNPQALAALNARREETLALRHKMENILQVRPENILLQPSGTQQEGRLNALFAAPR